MASSGKKKTTMAKLMRESRQREKRADKLARKEARKLAPADDARVDSDGFELGLPPADMVEMTVGASAGAATAAEPDDA
jgi:hypothetical protein